MLQPKKTKFRKQQKLSNRGIASSGNRVAFGDYGLQSMSRGNLSSKQIEAGRRAISRHIKREGKVWICVFPDKPITKKPLEVRMGKGKGSVEYWVPRIKPGRIIYEIKGVGKPLAKEALRKAASKLFLNAQFVEKMAV